MTRAHPGLGALAQVLVTAAAVALGALAWFADTAWFEQHGDAHRCVRYPAELIGISVARAAAVAVALLLLTVVRRRLARRLREQGLPSAASAARVALAALGALALTEGLLRWRWPHSEGARCAACPPIRAREGYGWGLVPSSKFRVSARGISYFVNAEGNRARSVEGKPDHDRPTVFVAGESITLGMGLPYEETFPALLEDRFDVQTVDLGVQAFGLDQAYLRAAEVLPSYEHPVALVSVFLAEDAVRAEDDSRPRLRVGRDGVLELVPEAPRWLRELRLRWLWRQVLPYHGNAEVEDMRAIVRATADLARRHGAYPLFLATNFLRPCFEVKGHRPWLYRTVLDDQGVPHADVELSLALKLPDEPHPGSEGHRRLADAVAAHLRAAGVL